MDATTNQIESENQSGGQASESKRADHRLERASKEAILSGGRVPRRLLNAARRLRGQK